MIWYTVFYYSEGGKGRLGKFALTPIAPLGGHPRESDCENQASVGGRGDLWEK
jgi:hypothetical protein